MQNTDMGEDGPVTVDFVFHFGTLPAVGCTQSPAIPVLSQVGSPKLCGSLRWTLPWVSTVGPYSNQLFWHFRRAGRHLLLLLLIADQWGTHVER
eukprot:3987953-Amphidinium_carterae.1